MDPQFLRVTNLTKGIRAFNEGAHQPTAIHPGSSKVLRIDHEGELENIKGRAKAGEVEVQEVDHETYRRERGESMGRPGFMAVSPEGGRPADPVERQNSVPYMPAAGGSMIGGAPAPIEHDGSEHRPQTDAQAREAMKLPANMVAFEDMSDDDLKAFIKDRTGSAPRGTPSRATLIARAEEAFAGTANPGPQQSLETGQVGAGRVNDPEAGKMSDGSTEGAGQPGGEPGRQAAASGQPPEEVV